MPLLAALDHVELPDVAEGRPLPPPPELPAVRASTVGSDEPLLDVEGVDVIDAYAELGILPPRRLRLRSGALSRLREAANQLPAGFGIVVLDAWRSVAEQQRLLDHYSRFGPTGQFVAAVDAESMRPPHTTGGAVDLTLAWEGRALALGTDFDSFTDDASYAAFEDRPSTVRSLRRALSWALLDAGFVPYVHEWWHWSYGDDVWSSANGVDARYDIVES